MSEKKRKKALSRTEEKEVRLLADAILKQQEWRHQQLVVKHERRIKAMLTRQRNLLRKNGKLRLP